MASPLTRGELKEQIAELLAENINPEKVDDQAFNDAIDFAMRECCRVGDFTFGVHNLSAAAGSFNFATCTITAVHDFLEMKFVSISTAAV